MGHKEAVTASPSEPSGDASPLAGAETEGLDNLLSVAEAFERSQQPDFNDITNPGMASTILTTLHKQMQAKLGLFGLFTICLGLKLMVNIFFNQI